MTQSPSITIGETALPIVVRRMAGARRMVLRYQPVQRALSLTLPRAVSMKQGLRFVESRRAWIAGQLETQTAVGLADGQVIPLAGMPHTLRHVGGRGLVEAEDGEIRVPGDEAFLPRRVREWLIKQARERITEGVRRYAGALGVTHRRVTLRDTVSRWGSCSHDGNLSFSWRLILAPPGVLDYVVCHEVAHLREMNHSPAFWAQVERICPDYSKYRHWLKRHGPELYGYG